MNSDGNYPNMGAALEIASNMAGIRRSRMAIVIFKFLKEIAEQETAIGRAVLDGVAQEVADFT